MDNKIPNMDYDADEVINEFKEKIKWPKSDEVTAVVKPTKIPLRLLISFLITAVVGGIAYYMMLPALNFKDTQMYLFLILLVVVFMLSFALVCRANKKIERKEYVKKKSLVPVIIVGVLVVVMAVGYLTGVTLSVQNRTATFLQSATATLKMTLKISAMTKCLVLTLTVQLRLPTSS